MHDGRAPWVSRPADKKLLALEGLEGVDGTFA